MSLPSSKAQPLVLPFDVLWLTSSALPPKAHTLSFGCSRMPRFPPLGCFPPPFPSPSKPQEWLLYFLNTNGIPANSSTTFTAKRQYCSVGKAQTPEQFAGFESWFHHLLTMRPWASFSTCPCFNFPKHKTMIFTAPIYKVLGRIKVVNTHNTFGTVQGAD